MMNWLFRRKTISSILEAELQDALLSFHQAAAAKEDWKARKSMLRARIIRLRNQITITKAQESWKSSHTTSWGADSLGLGNSSALDSEVTRLHTSASPAGRSGDGQ